MIKKLSLLFLIVACETAYADCTVPEKLSNKDFLAVVSGSDSPENPMAGQIYRMKFLDDGTYSYQTLKNGEKYSGTYTYEVIKKNVSIINAREKYNDLPVEYSMTMVCNNQKSGLYIYKQTRGISDQRANSARYFLMEEMD